MNTWRIILLVLGPVPIVVTALSVTRWVRPVPVEAHETNRVTVQQRAPGPAGPHSAEVELRCQERSELLGKQLPPDWQRLVCPPFVLAGDVTQAELKRWYVETVRPTVEAFTGSFHAQGPTQPLTVLLCRQEATYRELARRLFGDHHVSVYGYYRPHGRVLILNLSTGAGTLVHELTHALVDFDFPQVPDWFNEGLASLHEESRIRSAGPVISALGPLPAVEQDRPSIEGLENWRLPILQQALAEGRVPPLEHFVAGDFRRGDESLNYALARYLCLYLQRQGRLVAFYQQFRARAGQDPVGLETLAATLGPEDWNTINQRFRDWVRGLHWQSSRRRG